MDVEIQRPIRADFVVEQVLRVVDAIEPNFIMPQASKLAMDVINLALKRGIIHHLEELLPFFEKRVPHLEPYAH